VRFKHTFETHVYILYTSLLVTGTAAPNTDMGDFFTSDKAAVKQQRKGSMLMRMADAIKDAFKGTT